MSCFLYSRIAFDKCFNHMCLFLPEASAVILLNHLTILYAPLQTNNSFWLMWWCLLIVPLRAHFGHIHKVSCQGITFPPRWAGVNHSLYLNKWFYGCFLLFLPYSLYFSSCFCNTNVHTCIYAAAAFFFLQSRLKTFSSFNPQPDQSSLINAMKVRPMPLNPRAPSASTSQ